MDEKNEQIETIEENDENEEQIEGQEPETPEGQEATPARPPHGLLIVWEGENDAKPIISQVGETPPSPWQIAALIFEMERSAVNTLDEAMRRAHMARMQEQAELAGMAQRLKTEKVREEVRDRFLPSRRGRRRKTHD